MSKPSSNALAVRRRGGADPTLPAILEFQWPSTAIVNAPVPRSARGVTWVITSMVFALIAAMGLIPVDQVVTTRGIVVSQSPTILVQPLETAIVRSIDVRDGQLVRAGDVLARLDPTFAAADVGALSVQVAALQAEVTRLRAEAEGLPFSYAGDNPTLLLQASIFNQRQAERTSRLDTRGFDRRGGRRRLSRKSRIAAWRHWRGPTTRRSARRTAARLVKQSLAK